MRLPCSQTLHRPGPLLISTFPLAPHLPHQVVETYNYTAKANKDRLLPPSVATSWAVQYGWIDLLSFAWDVNAFRGWLRGKGRLGSSVWYELGTHVGFEDQLVVSLGGREGQGRRGSGDACVHVSCTAYVSLGCGLAGG